MHKKKHQLAAPGPRNYVAGGVALPHMFYLTTICGTGELA